jgi:putative Mg2+ transporter-C (MgtC) family protein
VGVYGNSIFRHVRLRGGRRLAARERAEAGPAKVSANPMRTAAIAGEALRTNWQVLVTDGPYRTFMAWMFVFGLGNLMIGAPQAIFLEDRLRASYLQAILATTIIPLLTMPIIIPVWARLLDRVHIVKFRAIHGWSFVTAAGVMWLAAWTESLWLFYVSGAMLGVGFAGGSIAWNIGHQDFASPERDALYMSVHVTLNGIRGVIAPFAAVALYKWLNASGVSHLTFAVCFAVNIVGAAGFVDLAMRVSGADGATRVISYVVSGVGFLGAGAIMKEGANITGLNTAATLWGSAAVGACAGAGLLPEAGIATLFVLASNTLLRPVVNYINRHPVAEHASEATYYVYVICGQQAQADVREGMQELLEAANYPVRAVEKHEIPPHNTEIEAELFATAVHAEELDQVVTQIEALPGVLQAFWNAGPQNN